MSIDLDMYEREERSKANKAAHAANQAIKAGIYSISPEVLARARSKVDSMSKRALRREARRVAQAVHLAVCDPASGAAVKEIQTSASELGKYAGLVREEVKVSVTHSLGFKGFQGLEGGVIDAVPLPPTSPASALPALPGDGAKSGG